MKSIEKEVYIINKFHLVKHSLISIIRKKSHLPVTIIIYRSLIFHNTTAYLNKLTCTDYVDFAKRQHRIKQTSWCKTDSSYLYVTFKVFKEDDNKGFGLVENLTMGQYDFNPFIRLKNQLFIATENFDREENLSPVLIPRMSKDMD